MRIANSPSVLRISTVALLAGAALYAAGCDDEEIRTNSTSTGGSSTTGGAAGTTAKAGSGGASGAGAAGAAGTTTAGKAGASGAGAGGASGKAGASGAGAAGAAGKAGASGAGAAGAAGASGAGAAGAAGSTLCGTATGDGTIGKQTKIADGGTFTSPFDATPSPDGCTIYFTAVDPTSGNGAVFSSAKDGTGLKRIDTGDVLVAPLGISVSSDGASLFVADVGFGAADSGGILKLASTGGTPAAVVTGSAPSVVAVVKEGATDQLYFAGLDAMGPAIFKSPASAPAATNILSPGNAVGGLGSSGTGFLFLSATTQELYSSTGGAGTLVVGGLSLGLPGGLAVSGDGTAALVASNNAGASGFFRVVLSTKAATHVAVGAGQVEAGGIHRAHNAEVYAFTDGLGSNGNGAVWVLEK